MFLAFAWFTYYPGGGEADFVGAYETMDEALVAARSKLDGWGDNAQVYDVAARAWTDIESG